MNIAVYKMNEHSGGQRKSAVAGAAFLYLVATACAIWAIQLPGIKEATDYVPALILVILGFPASLFVYKFPWSRHNINWFLGVSLAACVHLGLFIWLTGGSNSVFWPFVLFVVLGGTAYYRDRWPLVVVAVGSIGVTFSPLIYAKNVGNDFWGKVTIESLVIIVSFVFGRWMFDSAEEGSLHIAMLQKGRSDFLLAVAHQLKTPLTSLRVTLDLMRETITHSKEGPKEAKLVDTALRAEHRIERQLERIFEFFRLSSGDVSLDMQPGKISNLISSAQEYLKPQIEFKRLRVSINLPQEEPKVTMDSPRIETVLTNLIQNAVDFSPVQGEIKITVQVLPSTLLVSVRDSGQGVPKDEQRYIFEAFHKGIRVPIADTRSSTGIGLGLAISKSIVELHKGKIWLNSESKTGAEFCFSLPINQPTSNQ